MFNFTLPVKPRTKKNHTIPVILGNGRMVNLPSKAYKEFEKEVVVWFKEHYKTLEPIDKPCNIKAIYYKDKDFVSDLNGYNQALHDALVKAKLLKDDNHKIVVGTDGSRVRLDRSNPRIEVEITFLSESEL